MIMTNNKNVGSSENGYLELLGAAIRLAIFDYRSINPNSRGPNYSHYETAKFFLFSPNGLEAMLRRTGVDAILSIDYIRKMALKEDDEFFNQALSHEGNVSRHRKSWEENENVQ